MAEENKTNINVEQPRSSLSAVSNQSLWQWTNNNDFYAMIPSPYYSFYNNWVREWLRWYDGHVPWVHAGPMGLLSTHIGTTLVDRVTDSVFGGNLMFANARKPTVRIEKNGKSVGSALDFISNDFALATNLKGRIKSAIKNAYAGGFSLLKLNVSGGELWLDSLRADRFYIDVTARGDIRKVVSFLSFYTETVKKGSDGKRYALVEERRYEKIGMFDKEIPVVEYKIYSTSVPIQYFTTDSENFVMYEQLPKSVREVFKKDYPFELNVPQALNGFNDLGVFLLKATDDISNVPQLNLGESLLSHILTYLYEYDFYNTCFNTDMYLARGRVLVPKAMQSPQARTGNQNAGLDDFLYTKIETMNTDSQKPEAVQFALRADEWRNARNMLLESIATSIGISVSTLASYISDGSNRTAREVSAEESATTLFIENARRRFEKPLNDMLKTILRYYGYVDDVEIRWTRSGMTNQTLLVDTLTKAVNAGLISRQKAHHAFNYDDDEEQNQEDYELVEKDDAQRQNTIFGGDTF